MKGPHTRAAPLELFDLPLWFSASRALRTSNFAVQQLILLDILRLAYWQTRLLRLIFNDQLAMSDLDCLSRKDNMNST